MADLILQSTDTESSSVPLEPAPISVNDRSLSIERNIQLLANRRYRFCLYHLHRESEPLSIRNLTVLVERSLSPSDASISTRILEDEIQSFVDTYLPRLEDAGLVLVIDGQVALTPNPPFPLRAWLSATAEVELDR